MATTTFPCDKECLRILAELKEKQRQEEEARKEEEERAKQVGKLCVTFVMCRCGVNMLALCFDGRKALYIV